MICLNSTDTLEGGASVNAVVDYTVHGLVGTSFTQIAQGQLSNTDPSVLYTAAAAISIVSIILVNTHSAAVTVNLYLDPANAGTPRRMIPKNLSLGIGYSAHFDGARLSILDAVGLVTGVNISDTAFAASWDGVTTIAPSKNAVYDAMIQANIVGLKTTDSPTFADITDNGLTASQPVKTDGSKKLVSGFVTGEIVQVVNTQTGEVATGTTVIPSDDTIPQKTEGDQYMTLSITPKNTNNSLRINVVVFCSYDAAATATVALFQDDAADALAVGWQVPPGVNYPFFFAFIHKMTAGTTSPITFKVRIGGNTTGTITFNGVAGNRRYGGVLCSSITIWETAA